MPGAGLTLTKRPKSNIPGLSSKSLAIETIKKESLKGKLVIKYGQKTQIRSLINNEVTQLFKGCQPTNSDLHALDSKLKKEVQLIYAKQDYIKPTNLLVDTRPLCYRDLWSAKD